MEEEGGEGVVVAIRFLVCNLLPGYAKVPLYGAIISFSICVTLPIQTAFMCSLFLYPSVSSFL